MRFALVWKPITTRAVNIDPCGYILAIAQYAGSQSHIAVPARESGFSKKRKRPSYNPAPPGGYFPKTSRPRGASHAALRLVVPINPALATFSFLLSHTKAPLESVDLNLGEGALLVV